MISDTHPEAERRVIEALRKLSVAERLRLTFSLCDRTLALARRAIAKICPDAPAVEINRRFIEVHYGKELAARYQAHMDSR